MVRTNRVSHALDRRSGPQLKHRQAKQCERIARSIHEVTHLTICVSARPKPGKEHRRKLLGTNETYENPPRPQSNQSNKKLAVPYAQSVSRFQTMFEAWPTTIRSEQKLRPPRTRRGKRINHAAKGSGPYATFAAASRGPFLQAPPPKPRLVSILGKIVRMAPWKHLIRFGL